MLSLVVLVFVLFGFVSNEKKKQTLQAIVVDIDNSQGHYFVSAEDVKEVFYDQGFKLNEPFAYTELKILEKKLMEHPSIKNAEVYLTISGQLKFKISQRKPLVRVYSKRGDTYYIDEDGLLMPTSTEYTAHVPVANGNILFNYPQDRRINLASEKEFPDSLSRYNVLKSVYEIAKYIHQYPFWDAQISQIYVNQMNEIELIPRVGSHTILLGNTQELDRKFKTLKVFYTKGLNKVGWNHYSEINLKYKNQVVCKKL